MNLDNSWQGLNAMHGALGHTFIKNVKYAIWTNQEMRDRDRGKYASVISHN